MVVLAAIASVIVLPAILAVLGPRVEKGRIFKLKPDAGGFWGPRPRGSCATRLPYAVGVERDPARARDPVPPSVNLGLIDDRVVPTVPSSARHADQIRENFASREADALQVSVPQLDATSDHGEASTRSRAKLLALPGVARVDAATGSYGMLPSTRSWPRP